MSLFILCMGHRRTIGGVKVFFLLCRIICYSSHSLKAIFLYVKTYTLVKLSPLWPSGV